MLSIALAKVAENTAKRLLEKAEDKSAVEKELEELTKKLKALEDSRKLLKDIQAIDRSRKHQVDWDEEDEDLEAEQNKYFFYLEKEIKEVEKQISEKKKQLETSAEYDNEYDFLGMTDKSRDLYKENLNAKDKETTDKSFDLMEKSSKTKKK